jgi:hypothetical protein
MKTWTATLSFVFLSFLSTHSGKAQDGNSNATASAPLPSGTSWTRAEKEAIENAAKNRGLTSAKLLSLLRSGQLSEDPVADGTHTRAPSAPPIKSHIVQITPKKPADSPYTFLYKLPEDLSKCGGVIVALRQTMTDLGMSGGCPKPYNSAGVNGALLSYGNDASAHNETWTTKALAAIIFNTNPELNLADPNYAVEGFNFGAYASTRASCF